MPDDAFLPAFTDWVEAVAFGERDAADHGLDRLLALPVAVLAPAALALLARLLEQLAPAQPAQVAAALVEHLVVTGPDPGRAALIRDVVLAAGGQPRLLAGHAVEATAAAALECASFLTQAVANRDGVVPSSILRGL